MKPRITARLGTGDVARAAEILRGGGLVAFPTETVYGLGANALDAAAVAGIFEAKERPGWDPLIVHVSSRKMAEQVATVSPEADRLMQSFWPGALTLLLPRTAAVPEAVTAGRDLVGIRMPGHPVALDLIRAAGIPIAAPSANRFGHTSPTTAGHVLADLDGRIDAIIDGGAASVGVESTVLDVAGSVIYRPGAVSAGMIEAVLGVEVRIFEANASIDPPESLPSPGVGLRHYAPQARLVLVANEKSLQEAVLTSVGLVGVMLPDGWDAGVVAATFDWGAWQDGEGLARRLFAGLRELDEADVDTIVCPMPALGGIGDALRDRLEKASRSK